MNTSINTNRSIPRTDVGGGALAGLASAVLLQLLDGKAFDFDLWAGLLGAAIVFAAGYLPERHKNFAMSVAAVAASLGAALVGWLVFGQPLNHNVVSLAVPALIVAAVAYLAPPNAQSEVIAENAPGGPTRRE